MKLYLLLVKANQPHDTDSYEAKVVRAKDEIDARRFANEETGTEGKIWENSEKVFCVELTYEGTVGVILDSLYQ